jgi:outer membrane protein OmpA-like peptidoglycan-associated protein
MVVKRHIFLLTLLLAACISQAFAQPQAEFGTWTGSAYSVNDLVFSSLYANAERSEGYDDFLESVRFETLNIPVHSHHAFMPGTNLFNSFALEMRSTLKISEAGCYAFFLNSDDGSTLHIEESLVVDNGILHRMQIAAGEMYLEAGEYDAEVWYLSGLTGQRGLILDSKWLGKQGCKAKASAKTRKSFTLTSAALFATGSHELSADAHLALKSLCDTLMSEKFNKLIIHGHTDDTGNFTANKLLSQRRAGAVLKNLRSCLDLEGIEIEVEGFGESQPIADNATEDGRQQNRRVEILIE